MSRECDVALAGAISFNWLHKCGYHFTEGGILSKDGHTRPFDADASGTVFADGVAIVVLKRIEDAIADGDNIHAIILGSAVNNDGSMKVGFTAPSIDSQSAVVAEAMAVAGVSPASIGFVEAHGTGTALGDPIEVEALQQVFRSATDAKQFCALGSLKSNIGHLNTVSGVAGLIKAAMAVKTGEIPPNLNFETPNPKIDFANSPFFVPTKLTKWTRRRPAPCWRQLFRHRRNQYASHHRGATAGHFRENRALQCTSSSFRPRIRPRLILPVRVLPSISAPIRTKTLPTFVTRWRRAVHSIRLPASPSATTRKEAAEALELHRSRPSLLAVSAPPPNSR